MIHIVICDDNTDFAGLFGLRVAAMLERDDIRHEIVSLSSLDELTALLARESPDILFCDLMFGSERSVDRLKTVNLSRRTRLIFMTAFPEDAYNISDVEHTYYLIKSHITDEILSSALDRALDGLAHDERNMVIVRSGTQSRSLPTGSIMYIEGLNNNVMLVLRNGDQVIASITLKKIMEQLPPNFQQCQKSYAVNMDQVASFSPTQYVLQNGRVIPISPKNYTKFIQEYRRYVGQ